MRLVHSNPTPVRTRAHSAEAELRRMSEAELARLRFALIVALETIELGTPASRLVGRLARAARTEQQRRRHPGGTPRAA